MGMTGAGVKDQSRIKCGGATLTVPGSSEGTNMGKPFIVFCLVQGRGMDEARRQQMTELI